MSSAIYNDLSRLWEKRCPVCCDNFTSKSIGDLSDFFYRDSARPDGFQGKCKKCKHAVNRKSAKSAAWRRSHEPQKHRARKIINNAVRRGKIKRQPCIVCGEAKTHAHHKDYSKPLDIVFLCQKHHYEEHKRMRASAPQESI